MRGRPTALPPLHLSDFPTIGMDGQRSNVATFAQVLLAGLAPGAVLVMDVAHEDGCPCGESRAVGDAALERCTCDTVDLTLHLQRPR